MAARFGGSASIDVGVMSVIVLVLGIVVTGLGLAALGFAIPIIELSLGVTLVSAGTTAVCSGLLLIGLSAAIAELRRVGDLLKSRPMAARRAPAPEREHAATAAAPVSAGAPQTPAVSMPAAPPPAAAPAPHPASATSLGPILAAASQPETAPAMTATPRPAPSPPSRQRSDVPVAHDLRHAEPSPASAADASASALERLRSSMPRAERQRAEPAMVPENEGVPLSPNGGQASVQTRRTPTAEPALEPRLSPDDRLGSVTAEATKASRLDFLFRSRQQAASRAEAGETNWPAGPARSSAPDAAGPTRYAEPARSSPPVASTAPAPPTLPPAPTVEPRPRDLGAKAVDPSGSVLKSGVVDGLAYTLYTDGSIEAKLPDGTVRFGSISELRAHIEKHP